MAFKQVQDLDADVVISMGGMNKETKKKNPTTAEGYYLGYRQVPSKKAKSGFAFLHFLQTEDGNLGVWGKTNLDQKLKNVTPGTMVRITQSGMVPTPNGDMYKFTVEIDEENMIEVTAPKALTPNEAAEEAEELEDPNADDDLENEEEQLDEVPAARTKAPARAAKPASAAQQSKVKSLLGARNRSA